jgi:hypothetical protein
LQGVVEVVHTLAVLVQVPHNLIQEVVVIPLYMGVVVQVVQVVRVPYMFKAMTSMLMYMGVAEDLEYLALYPVVL